MAKDSLENITPSTHVDEAIEAADISREDVTAIPLVEAGTSGTDQLPAEVLVAESSSPEKPAGEGGGGRRELMKSAALVSIGNLGSSAMGMVRQIVVSATGVANATPFLAGLVPVQTFYDLMVNGSTSSVLIPTFNDYADKRNELRRLVFTLVNLVLLIALASSIIYFFVSPWLVTSVIGQGYPFDAQQRILISSRIVFFSLLALAPFSILLAALFACKEFGWPAFATAAYHLGIVIGAIIAAFIGIEQFGYLGLSFGVLIGAAGELVLLMPGIRNQQMRYLFVLDLQHPALRRILKLYVPIAISFLASTAVIYLDVYLYSTTPCMEFMKHLDRAYCSEANFAAKSFATTLIQFPIGLVASALSFAVLPTLTTHIREGNLDRFKETLLLGFRLGLLLMIPSAAGLIVLQLPIVSLIFEHGKATAAGSVLGAVALQNYAYQLPFVAMDQLLIAAFYARKNTVIPVSIGIVTILGYLAIAFPFSHTIGLPALAFANTVQNALRPILGLILLRMAIGPMHLGRLASTLLKILLATAMMVILAWALQSALALVPLFSLSTLLGRLLTVVAVGGLSAAAYFGGLLVLKVEEVNLIKGAVLAKLGKR